MKQCPKCGRLISANAQKCKYCNEWLTDTGNTTVRLGERRRGQSGSGNARPKIIAGVVLGVIIAATLAVWGLWDRTDTTGDTTGNAATDTTATVNVNGDLPPVRQRVADDTEEFAKGLPLKADVISMDQVTYSPADNTLRFVWTYSGAQQGKQLSTQIRQNMLDMVLAGGVNLLDHCREAQGTIVVDYRDTRGKSLGQVTIQPTDYNN